MQLLKHRQRPEARDYYMTPAEHRQEAERLAWVIDDVLQSGAKRSLGDLIAFAQLHLDLAIAPPGQAGDAARE